MTKPDWYPQDVWERAVAARREFHDDDSRPIPMWPLLDRIIARALVEAERRGMERAAEIYREGAGPEEWGWDYFSEAYHAIRAAAKEIEP